MKDKLLVLYYILIEGNTCTVCDKDTPGAIPVCDFKWYSDYKWQQDCLTDRLEHREKYSDKEDVDAVILRLSHWLATHRPAEDGVNAVAI